MYKQIKSYKNHLIINASTEAKKLGNSKVANMILLGAASSLIPIIKESIPKAIKILFANKSEKIFQLNLKAFEVGKQLAKNFTEFIY